MAPPDGEQGVRDMSKARARARKKARLAATQAAASAPQQAHETGVDHTPANLAAEQAADKTHPGKFDAKAPPGGGMKNTSGKGAPNLAASTRGSARSR